MFGDCGLLCHVSMSGKWPGGVKLSADTCPSCTQLTDASGPVGWALDLLCKAGPREVTHKVNPTCVASGGAEQLAKTITYVLITQILNTQIRTFSHIV